MKPHTQEVLAILDTHKKGLKTTLYRSYLVLLYQEMEASLDGLRFFDFLTFWVVLFIVSHDYLIVTNFFGGIFGNF